MSTRINLLLKDAVSGKAELLRALEVVGVWLREGCRVSVIFKRDTRSLAQNRIMWSVLTDLAEQVVWPDGRVLSPEGWKHYLSGSLAGQEMFPAFQGDGVVVITKGSATSDMTIAEMCDVVTLGHAVGDHHGVKWSRTSLGRDVPDEMTTGKRQRQLETS